MAEAAPWVPGETFKVADDTELVRKAGRGDEAAFRTLVAREARYLYGIAHALTDNAADAEDVVQETFVAAIGSRFRGEASVRTWLVKILVRRVAMLHRKRQRGMVPLDTEGGSEPTDEGPRASAGSEARLDLSTMLASLSPEHRAVIVLREVQGLKYEEMAAVLGVPQGTVESRLHRAREELRRRFKGYL